MCSFYSYFISPLFSEPAHFLCYTFLMWPFRSKKKEPTKKFKRPGQVIKRLVVGAIIGGAIGSIIGKTVGEEDEVQKTDDASAEEKE